jgi:dTDP-4-dehydrorhamnose reductase
VVIRRAGRSANGAVTVRRSTRRRKPARLLFVTGGAGYLGRHIVTSRTTERWEIVAPDSRGFDLRNAASVRSVVRDWNPTAIIHTAYRRGDRGSIVDATQNIAEAAEACRARLVHVSTDVVFRGGRDAYTERDAPSPIIDYGLHKTDAEHAVSSTCPGAVIVRTSLLVGGRELSSHEVAVHEAIEARSPMVFFTDEIRCPVLVGDLAASLVELAERTDITGVLHLAGPDAMSRADLAIRIAHRHRWNPWKLRFGTLAESGLNRPGRVVLDSSVALSHGLSVRGPGSW